MDHNNFEKMFLRVSKPDKLEVKANNRRLYLGGEKISPKLRPEELRTEYLKYTWWLEQLKSRYCWTLEDALEFIRLFQPLADNVDWCLLLGGGVLNNGHGSDLDILAYPQHANVNRSDLIAVLTDKFEMSSIPVADICEFTYSSKPVEVIFQTYR